MSFPRAILHIDGDAFFASCEVAKDPTLRGKPVVTGKERGIVSAATYEAKARGVTRGMKLYEVRKICPDAVILPSDYETYSIFSKRMFDIVRRYTPAVEEYGIDECFADLTGMRRVNRMSYPEMAMAIQRELNRELNITFSIGVSVTKTLAKVGSKWKKPAGLTLIPLSEASQFLAKLPVGAIWGIGPNTAAYLAKFGIRTAFDFARKDEAWVTAKLAKPYVEKWRELNGEVSDELDTEGKQTYQSISKTKTFTPPSHDPVFLRTQLSKNVENACIKARRWKLVAVKAFFFLKTQDFRYRGCEIALARPTALPQEILAAVESQFDNVFECGKEYRATGVTLLGLTEEGHEQLDLFGAAGASESMRKVLASVDEMTARYGKHAVFLGSSFTAMKHPAHEGARADTPTRVKISFKGETARKRLAVPLLGEVN